MKTKQHSFFFLGLILLCLALATPFVVKSQTLDKALESTLEETIKKLPQMLPISSVTADDIQRIRNEVYNTFDLYERQLTLCNEAKETIRIISIKSMDEQLKELDRIKVAILKQDASILDLQAIRSDLTTKLSQLQKTLRKAKRRATFERVAYTSTIGLLGYLLIKDNLPP